MLLIFCVCCCAPKVTLSLLWKWTILLKNMKNFWSIEKLNYLLITHVTCLLSVSTLKCNRCIPPNPDNCEEAQCISSAYLCGALKFTSFAGMLIFIIRFFHSFHWLSSHKKVTALFQVICKSGKPAWERVFRRKNVSRTQSTLEWPESWFPAIVAPRTCATPNRPLVTAVYCYLPWRPDLHFCSNETHFNAF